MWRGSIPFLTTQPTATQAWTKAWGKGHTRMHGWAGHRNPGQASAEPCGPLWGNEQSLKHLLKGRLDYPRTSREMRDSPRPLGNEDGEALGRRRIKSPAGPELRGLPKKTSAKVWGWKDRWSPRRAEASTGRLCASEAGEAGCEG